MNLDMQMIELLNPGKLRIKQSINISELLQNFQANESRYPNEPIRNIYACKYIYFTSEISSRVESSNILIVILVH